MIKLQTQICFTGRTYLFSGSWLSTVYSTKNNQQNHIGTFLYLIQVKAVLFTII